MNLSHFSDEGLRHPNAMEVLEDVIQRPGFYESFSDPASALARLEGVMEEHGCVRADTAAGITMGWALESEGLKNTALLRWGGCLLILTVGSDGAYAIEPVVKNITNPSPQDAERVREWLRLKHFEHVWSVGGLAAEAWAEVVSALPPKPQDE